MLIASGFKRSKVCPCCEVSNSYYNESDRLYPWSEDTKCLSVEDEPEEWNEIPCWDPSFFLGCEVPRRVCDTSNTHDHEDCKQDNSASRSLEKTHWHILYFPSVDETMEGICSEEKSDQVQRNQIMNGDFTTKEKYDKVNCCEVDQIWIERNIRCPDIILPDDKRSEIRSENSECKDDLRFSQWGKIGNCKGKNKCSNDCCSFWNNRSSIGRARTIDKCSIEEENSAPHDHISKISKSIREWECWTNDNQWDKKSYCQPYRRSHKWPNTRIDEISETCGEKKYSEDRDKLGDDHIDRQSILGLHRK